LATTRTIDPSLQTVLVFCLDEHRFAADLDRVERVVAVVEATPLPGAPGMVRGIINVEGAVVPVLDLRRRLGLEAVPDRLSDRLIIARAGGGRAALAVDAVLGVERLSGMALTPPDRILPQPAKVAAVATTPDGILVIEDLDRLLSQEEDLQLGNALNTHAAASAAGDDRPGAPSDR
jgi:purine-binding chemotaxis protein CheW